MERKTSASNSRMYFISDIFSKSELKNTILNWYNFLPLIRFNKIERSKKENILYQVLLSIKNEILDSLNNTLNIGPLRSMPNRIEMFTGEESQNVGVYGEDALKLLYLSKYQSSKKTNKSLENKVNYWLKNYGYKFKWKMLRGNLGEFILIDKNGLNVSIKDVGFGISQILPIVIQAYNSNSHDITIIEQPEIHLHSKAQAELGDLFITAMNHNRKNRFIIETHSENLLLRIRRRIAENKIEIKNNELKIKNEDISIYYVKNDGESSKVHEIKINENGEFDEKNIDEFKDFFSYDFEEAMELTKCISKIKNM